MATEDELPEKLDKLEITPILPQVKLMDVNLPVQLNPFFGNEQKECAFERKVEKTTCASKIKSWNTLNGTRPSNQNCRRCRNRRPSENVLDELQQSTSTSPISDSIEWNRTPTSGILKQTLKKCTSPLGGSGNRKVLVREPILKALQTCLHPQINLQRKYASAGTPKSTPRSNSPLTTKGVSDFRDLIDECRSLLSEDVDFSGRLNQLCLSNRNSKNFTTIQKRKIQNNPMVISRNTTRLKLNMVTMSLPSTENTAINEDQYNSHVSMPALLCSSIFSTTQQRNVTNLSSEQLSNHARCNTTCSQQAVNSVAAGSGDDVTIDELASYFDTLVHIPKKMSSMAEMMYI